MVKEVYDILKNFQEKKNPLSMGNRPKAYPLVWSMKNLFATPPLPDETPSLYTHVHDKAEKTL